MRVVLDTNVYISAVLFGGLCENVLEKLSSEGSFIFASPFILKEIKYVLEQKFGWEKMRFDLILKDIKDRTILIKPRKRVCIIKEKRDDNKILECALASKSDLLITGDKKHILPIRNFRGTRIISPRQFLEGY